MHLLTHIQSVRVSNRCPSFLLSDTGRRKVDNRWISVEDSLKSCTLQDGTTNTAGLYLSILLSDNLYNQHGYEHL